MRKLLIAFVLAFTVLLPITSMTEAHAGGRDDDRGRRSNDDIGQSDRDDGPRSGSDRDARNERHARVRFAMTSQPQSAPAAGKAKRRPHRSVAATPAPVAGPSPVAGPKAEAAPEAPTAAPAAEVRAPEPAPASEPLSDDLNAESKIDLGGSAPKGSTHDIDDVRTVDDRAEEKDAEDVAAFVGPLPSLPDELVSAGVMAAAPVIAAAAAGGGTVDQCSNFGTSGGDTITCHVTITNDFLYVAATPNNPLGLATIVTSLTCTGSAICGPGGTTTSTVPVTTISQCNNAGTGVGGGTTVTCVVTVTNNLTGYPLGASIDSTVKQCQSPGAVNTLTCTATPSGNDRTGDGGPGAQKVTQCNASGGQAGTMTCTVTAPVSQNTGLPITIDQCNGSGTTGANTVTCTATITNNFIASIPAVVPGPGGGGPGGGGPGPGPGPGGPGPSGPGPGGGGGPGPDDGDDDSDGPDSDTDGPNGPDSSGPNGPDGPDGSGGSSGPEGRGQRISASVDKRELSATGIDAMTYSGIASLLILFGGTLIAVSRPRRRRALASSSAEAS